MVGWKKWPYWARGGITGGVVSVVYTGITYFIYYPRDCGPNGLCDLAFSLLNVHIFPIMNVIENFTNRSYIDYSLPIQVFQFLLSSLITGLIFGFLIGLLYGKIKYRNKLK